MPIQKLKEFLDGRDIKYVVISHSVAYTAQGVAALTHISGKELAKTVIVKIAVEIRYPRKQCCTCIGGRVQRAVSRLRNGAMPPFGNLYDMQVFADESLARDKEIAFNAGSHRELVRLAWEDFVRLVQPKIVRFAAGSIHFTAA